MSTPSTLPLPLPTTHWDRKRPSCAGVDFMFKTYSQRDLSNFSSNLSTDITQACKKRTEAAHSPTPSVCTPLPQMVYLLLQRQWTFSLMNVSCTWHLLCISANICCASPSALTYPFYNSYWQSTLMAPLFNTYTPVTISVSRVLAYQKLVDMSLHEQNALEKR